jgi:hypothetical protein
LKYLPTSILSLALLFATYLLVMLWLVRRIYNSLAWHFIFFGLTLLWVEIAIALHVVWGIALDPESLAIVSVLLLKTISYSIGFTIWRFVDWKRLRGRAKEFDRTRSGR